MKKVISAALTVTVLATMGVALSDDDDNDASIWSWFDRTTPGINSNEHRLYVEDCGGCHFPYQPGDDTVHQHGGVSRLLITTEF